MSTIDVANITDGTDTVATGYVINGSAKAWVNFNGSGTVAIRDSLNVGSITDSGTGVYVINFTNNFSNVNYSATVGSAAGGVTYYPPSDYTASSVKQVTKGSSNTVFDSEIVGLKAHGELA